MASENRQKKTFKYLCEHCGYKTNRKWSFDYHLSRKNPCKPIEIESTVSKDEQNVNPVLKNEKNEQNVNSFERNSFKFEQNINPSNQNYSCDMCKKVFTFKSSLKRHMKTCKGTHDPLQCPICKVVFSSAPAKSRHTKNGKCKPPESDKVEQLEAKIQQLENALTQRDLIKQIEQPVVHNTYNITNNSMTTNTTNTTTNTTNVINYNNFDSPSLSHITSQMIGEMYLKADRELPRMIGNAVRSIYKGHRENDTIKIKYGNQAGFAEVRQDDETRILPVSDVLETVLSQTTTFCGKELMKCCGDDIGQIPGPNVIHHANELAVLHWWFVPETQAARQGFFKFVKSALL